MLMMIACLAANDALFPAMQLPAACAPPPLLHSPSVADAAAVAVESIAMMPYGDHAALSSFVTWQGTTMSFLYSNEWDSPSHS